MHANTKLLDNIILYSLLCNVCIYDVFTVLYKFCAAKMLKFLLKVRFQH